MPQATVSTDFGEPIPLESLDGANVQLRPLPYGMKLERRDRATKMYMEMEEKKGKRGRQTEATVDKFSIETLNKLAVAYDFKYCIGEHNLEDANGNKLDFSNPMTLDVLDPRVGTELEQLVNRLNGEDEDEELEDFFKRHTSSSAEEVLTESTPVS